MYTSTEVQIAQAYNTQEYWKLTLNHTSHEFLRGAIPKRINTPGSLWALPSKPQDQIELVLRSDEFREYLEKVSDSEPHFIYTSQLTLRPARWSPE
jgi:hypothetical protein